MLENTGPMSFKDIWYICKKCGKTSTRSGIIKNFDNICSECRNVSDVVNRDDSELKKTLRLVDLVLENTGKKQPELPVVRTYSFNCVVCEDRVIEHGILGKSMFLCLSCRAEAIKNADH